MIEKLKDMLERSVEGLYKRIDGIKLQNEDRDERVAILQAKENSLEQMEKGKNLILTGLNCDVSISAVVKKLKKLLGTKLKEDHLHYVTKLMSEGPIKLRVVFYAKAKRDIVFREKRNLKGNYRKEDCREHAKVFQHNLQNDGVSWHCSTPANEFYGCSSL